MKPSMRVGAAFFLLLVVSGCGGIMGRGDWDPFRSASEGRVTILVFNDGRTPVSIRAVAPGQRLILGSVEGNSRASFAIPWSFTQEVRFQLEPLTGRSYTTSGITARPGDRLSLRVQDPIQRSRVQR
jgi:hypothetical protein